LRSLRREYMGKSFGMSIRMDRVLLDQIAGRWDLLILSALCDHEGRARFNVLKRSVPGKSQKMLRSACDSLNEVAWWRVLSLPSLRWVSNTPSLNSARRCTLLLQLFVNGQVNTLPLCWTPRSPSMLRRSPTNRTLAGSGTISRANQ
jgi:hypothetical protein